VLVFLNGKFAPEGRAVVSVFDRGFLYGDGLFETVRVFNGKPFRWSQHIERLQRGAESLKIKLPFSTHVLRGFADELVQKQQIRDCLLRLTLSRGVGVRGYSPKGAEQPTFVMSLHPAPHPAFSHPHPSDGRGAGGEGVFPKWKLITSSFRLPANDPLAQFKTSNKLPQILARTEADAAGADEALLLNTDGFVIEGASSNLFWIERDTICTPPLTSGVLPGVTRAVILEICKSLSVATRQANISPDELHRADGIFLSLSSWGVVEAVLLDGRVLKPSAVVNKICGAYQELVHAETM